VIALIVPATLPAVQRAFTALDDDLTAAMPATQTLGQTYYQEFAATDGALDEAETSATGLTVIAGGVSFSDVVRVYETSAPRSRRQGVRVASGVGLILAEEGLDANRLNPELTLALTTAVPEPSSLSCYWGCRWSLPGVERRVERRVRQRHWHAEQLPSPHTHVKPSPALSPS